MLFLSIHPKYVEAIVEGRKTVELRKRKPKVEAGFTVVIYATMPRCEAVAVGRVDAIQVATPCSLWRDCGARTGISAAVFSDYYSGSEKAVGIHLSNISVFAEPVSLQELRSQWSGFQPPQQYRYLDNEQRKFIRSRLKAKHNCLVQ